MLELENFWNSTTGPVMIPSEKIAGYQPIKRTVFLGENFLGPFFTDQDALEITLSHGAKVYCADVPENRILLDVSRLED
jgi:hypothetical protein